MPTDELPWLDYTGQTTPELLAVKASHRIDSILCAFEQGIQLKRRPTADERLVLAIKALEREVNNGGYDQFFRNSSRKYAPIIVSCLTRVGCEETAALTAEAIAALKIDSITVKSVNAALSVEDAERDELLDAIDQKYYRHVCEIESKLFHFIEANQERIQLEKTYIKPPEKKRGFSQSSKLHIYLQSAFGLFGKPVVDASELDRPTLDRVRILARELAVEHAPQATELQIEGTVQLFLFAWFLRKGDLTACEPFARQAFELVREDTVHLISHREWVNRLATASRCGDADAAALAYLIYLSEDSEPESEFIVKRAEFWVQPLQQHATALPKSIEFFRAHFPAIDLDTPFVSKIVGTA